MMKGKIMPAFGRDRVDPELLPVLDFLGMSELTLASLPEARAGLVAMLAALAVPDGLPVSVETVWFAGVGGDVRGLLYRPTTAAGMRPAILHIHGGGYVMGVPEMSAADNMRLAAELGAVVLSVDYRLAPEVRFPGAVEDCYAGLGWLQAQAERLSIDPARIAVAGESAGGGLAAGLCLLARDRGQYAVALQLLDAPMLDDRTCARSDISAMVGEFVWTPDKNRFGWTALLGAAPGGEAVSCYAAAARADDVTGLPPTYISVGALDLFLEEDIDYARRLALAGVQVELHVYPGCIHGYAVGQGAAIVGLAQHNRMTAFRRAFALTAA